MRQHALFFHISSPLLLYRINLLTGDVKGITTDHYKCSWDITIRHLETNSSLRFWDSRGRVRVGFSGAKESEQDALTFITFLTISMFPHTYEGVLAGKLA